MNRSVVRVAAISAMTIVSQATVSRSAAGSNPSEIKHIIVPMSKGLVNAEARNIEKHWTPLIVHLKGNAHVMICTAKKSPRGA
jgi:hypothetical protein